ncbi:hypothetical protein [Priestia megaterium]|uniref:hypothetical protein n=1 Tax=Priestia megaterium TaxID=1404 RepID=UPI003101A399
MSARTNLNNDYTITLEWLYEITEKHDNKYLVMDEFYDNWDNIKNEKSPNLETILNYMFNRGYDLVSIQPMGNPNCKEMVFVRR